MENCKPCLDLSSAPWVSGNEERHACQITGQGVLLECLFPVNHYILDKLLNSGSMRQTCTFLSLVLLKYVFVSPVNKLTVLLMTFRLLGFFYPFYSNILENKHLNECKSEDNVFVCVCVCVIWEVWKKDEHKTTQLNKLQFSELWKWSVETEWQKF